MLRLFFVLTTPLNTEKLGAEQLVNRIYFKVELCPSVRLKLKISVTTESIGLYSSKFREYTSWSFDGFKLFFYFSELTQKLELAKDVTEEVAQLIQALYFSGSASFDLEKRGWFDKVGFHYIKQSNSLTKFVQGSKGIR